MWHPRINSAGHYERAGGLDGEGGRPTGEASVFSDLSFSMHSPSSEALAPWLGSEGVSLSDWGTARSSVPGLRGGPGPSVPVCIQFCSDTCIPVMVALGSSFFFCLLLFDLSTPAGARVPLAPSVVGDVKTSSVCGGDRLGSSGRPGVCA